MATSALVSSTVFINAVPKPSYASSPAKFSRVSFAKVEYNGGRGNPRRQLTCNAQKYGEDAAKIASDITEDAKKSANAGIDAAGDQTNELTGKAVDIAEDAGKKAEEAKDNVFAAAGDGKDKAAGDAETVADKVNEFAQAVGDKAQAIKDAATE